MVSIELLTRPVTAAGFYDMPAADYHADPCPDPSLNHTVCKLLIDRSPAHARHAHPRLTPSAAHADSAEMIVIGKAAHALLLGRGSALAVMEYDDYRTKAARDARAAAYAQGFTPIKAMDYERAAAMATRAHPYLMDLMVGPAWHAEMVAIARRESLWLRTMIDASSVNLRRLVDYKTTTRSSAPAACANMVRGYATQQAFITMILDILHPAGAGRREFTFMFQEQEPPYAVTLHRCDAALMEIASRQVDRAVLKWSMCMSLNKWPGYPLGPHLVGPKPWEIDDELDRQQQEAEGE